MKKYLFTLVLFTLSIYAFSQDTLVMATGDTLKNLKIISVDDQFIYVQQKINGESWNSLIKKEKVSKYIISNPISNSNNIIQSQINNNPTNKEKININKEIVSIDFGFGYNKILKKTEDFSEKILNDKIDELRTIPTFNFTIFFYLNKNFGLGGRINFSKKTSSEFNNVLYYQDPINGIKTLWSGKFNRSINNFSFLITNKLKLDNKNKHNIHLTMYLGKNFLTQGGEYKFTYVDSYNNIISYSNNTTKLINNKKWSLSGSMSYEYKIFDNIFLGVEANYHHYKIYELKYEDKYEDKGEINLSRAGVNAFIRFK